VQRIYSTRLARWEDEHTVAAFLAHFDCSAKCLCAESSADQCNCACLGRFHGHIAQCYLEVE
jgi:hypothetical protein